jgi:ribosomal-protein-alanine N-acetyltransferase
MLETERLLIDKFTVADAPFILALLNMPAWLEFIGDRGVRTLEDAHQYILDNPINSYRQHGYGPYGVRLKSTNALIGMCGLHRRTFLPDIDIGFAFLPNYAGQGYGYESASALIAYGRDILGFTRITGITKATNANSIRLLGKLGLCFEKKFVFHPDQPESLLFGMALTKS